MFRDASMNIRDWVLNKEGVNNYIQLNDRNASKTIKVLGYQWDYKYAILSVTPSSVLQRSDSTDLTKRNVFKSSPQCLIPWEFSPPFSTRKVVSSGHMVQKL